MDIQWSNSETPGLPLIQIKSTQDKASLLPTPDWKYDHQKHKIHPIHKVSIFVK